MTNALAIWRAQRVRRWHCNPDLSETSDFIDGHSARVTKLILALHPGASRSLLVAALTHDDGEHAVGDIPQPVKAVLRELEPAAWERILATEEDALAELWGNVGGDGLSEHEARWLRFCDRLDAFIWAATHGARMDRSGWPADRDWLLEEAWHLGQWVAVGEALDDVAPAGPRHSPQGSAGVASDDPSATHA